MSLDQIAVLQAAEQVKMQVRCTYRQNTASIAKGEGMVTESALVTNLGWEARRARVALDQLVRDGG